MDPRKGEEIRSIGEGRGREEEGYSCGNLSFASDSISEEAEGCILLVHKTVTDLFQDISRAICNVCSLRSFHHK